MPNMFYRDSSNNRYYLNSNKILVFPCAYRAPSIDPEARLNSEKSLTHVGGLGGGHQNYIIKPTGGISETDLTIVLNGYTFILSQVDLSEILADGAAEIYVAIKTDSYYITNGITSFKLSSWYETDTNENTDTTNEVLDVKIGSGDTQYFTGLAFSSSKISGNNITCIKIYGLPGVFKNIYPLKITSGETGTNSLVFNSVKDEFGEGSNTNDATGNYANAFGYSTTAVGDYSHAEGNSTLANGDSTHAEGNTTKAYSEGSHAEGNETIAGNSENLTNSKYAHAEGSYTKAIGWAAHAEGGANYTTTNQQYTIASGTFSHAEGQETKAYGNGSHAEGGWTKTGISGDTSKGQYAHAEGSYTSAIGNYSHAEGFSTLASNDYSHAAGKFTLALGQCSHAEGFSSSNNIALTSDTHDASALKYNVPSGAIANDYVTIGSVFSYNNLRGVVTAKEYSAGYITYTLNSSLGRLSNTNVNIFNNVAYGDCSHTEGQDTRAYGKYSHAEGIGTVANNDYQHVFGKYNVLDGANLTAKSVEIVGYGDSTVSAKNIRRLDENGNEWLSGNLYIGDSLSALTSSSTYKLYVNGSAFVNGESVFGDESTFFNKVVVGTQITGDNIAFQASGATTNKFIVYGNGNVEANTYTAKSDKRLKENIILFEPKKSILDLPVYKFDFINGTKNNIGCLAQDLQEICPEIVHENTEGYLTIQEDKIVYLLLEEVKKLKKEIEELKK